MTHAIASISDRTWLWATRLLIASGLVTIASQMTQSAAYTPPSQPVAAGAAPSGQAAPAPAPRPESAFPAHRLRVDRDLLHGDFVWADDGVPPGRVSVLIDLSAQMLHVFRGGREIGRAVILYGTDENPTPLGAFTITQKNIDHESNIYDARMPYMMRLTDDGIAIHGSQVVYGRASRGCIGVPDEFAALLFAQARLGDRVVIVGEPSPTAAHPASPAA